jgi:hypothetical protein
MSLSGTHYFVCVFSSLQVPGLFPALTSLDLSRSLCDSSTAMEFIPIIRVRTPPFASLELAGNDSISTADLNTIQTAVASASAVSTPLAAARGGAESTTTACSSQ